MEKRQIFFIVGAAGFIGGWLAETLSLKKNTHVIAGVKKWSNAARISRFPVDIVLCDIMNTRQISKAMSNATAVVHCAMGDSDTIIKGTENLLCAAQKCGVQNFIFLSSALVYGQASGEVDESFPTKITGNNYADAKIIAEQLCWDFLNKGVPVTILRPSIVYGPFCRGWTINIAEKLQSGGWGIFRNTGDGICNLIYIKDLISAIILAANNNNAIGETFNINGPQLITWNQYFQTFNSALNLPPLKRISKFKAKLKSELRHHLELLSSHSKHKYGDSIRHLNRRFKSSELITFQIKKILDTYPSKFELEKLYKQNCLYSNKKAKSKLGFSPTYQLSLGLKESVQWLKHHGYA